MNTEYQAEREARAEFFKETLLPEILDSPRVLSVNELPGLYKIAFVDGIVADYYPRADRICFPNYKNKWVSNGYSELEKMI